MKEFWKMVNKSVVVTGMVTVALVVTACYMWATGMELPPLLRDLILLTCGVAFGGKLPELIGFIRKPKEE